MDGRAAYLPDFLIVGAMKSGTTTLYRDLILHPEVFMPEDKEPETLANSSDPDQVRREYRTLFPRSAEGLVKGEASTAYTKRPDFEGVAERAREVLGPGLKVVYMRRDPVERLVSHYKHWVQRKKTDAPIGRALRDHPELIDYSRYDWQIAPWKQAFGNEAVLEIELDDYSANRRPVVERVLRHIGADPARLPDLDEDLIANSAAEMKHIDNPLLDAFVRSRLFSRRIKPLLPRAMRVKARQTLLPRPEPVDVALSTEDLAFIAERLADKADHAL